MWRSFKHKVRRRNSKGQNSTAKTIKLPTSPDPLGLVHLNKDIITTPDDDIAERYEVDIVAIHGLNGTAYGTWTCERTDERRQEKPSTFWLKDFLPQSIPGARIFTYGYPAQVLFSTSRATIYDYAQHLLYALASVRPGQERRPIIFISHSLGGIVCKQALILAKEDPQFHHILDSTVGVLFFGTPHRGARGTPDMGIILANVLDTALKVSMVRFFKGKSRTDLLRKLKANSEDLRRITASFSFVCEKLQIVTIYETQEQEFLGKLVRSNDPSVVCILPQVLTALV